MKTFNVFYTLLILYVVLLMVYVKTGKKGYFYAAGGVFIADIVIMLKQVNNPKQ